MMLKGNLNMCCGIKFSFKGIQKWLGSHRTHEMRNEINADILN